MPSSRPKIVIYSDEETIEKLKIIANEDGRKVSNYCDVLIREHVKNYEKNNGNISIGDITQKGNNNIIKIGN